MHYCGLDVGSKNSYVYVSDAAGARVIGRELPTEKAPLVGALRPYVELGLR